MNIIICGAGRVGFTIAKLLSEQNLSITVIDQSSDDIQKINETLDVKVNTICRGRAFSAAAIILTCGTGTRMMSKRSTVMFHQSSSFLGGKMSDITAYLDNVKSLEKVIYGMLAEKTKKDAEWWKNKMRSDMFLTSDELLEIGVIDQII